MGVFFWRKPAAVGGDGEENDVEVKPMVWKDDPEANAVSIVATTRQTKRACPLSHPLPLALSHPLSQNWLSELTFWWVQPMFSRAA